VSHGETEEGRGEEMEASDKESGDKQRGGEGGGGESRPARGERAEETETKIGKRAMMKGRRGSAK